MSHPLPNLSRTEAWYVAQAAALSFETAWIPAEDGSAAFVPDTAASVRAAALTQALHTLHRDGAGDPPEFAEAATVELVRACLRGLDTARQRLGDAFEAEAITPRLLRAWWGALWSLAADGADVASTQGLRMTLQAAFPGASGAVGLIVSPQMVVPSPTEAGALAPWAVMIANALNLDGLSAVEIAAIHVEERRPVRAASVLRHAARRSGGLTDRTLSWWALASAREDRREAWLAAATLYDEGFDPNAIEEVPEVDPEPPGPEGPRSGAPDGPGDEASATWTEDNTRRPGPDRPPSPGFSSAWIVGGLALAGILLLPRRS
ncbi:MAG: hypothetical protein AAF791_05435 [Bacteroidota bacterium]